MNKLIGKLCFSLVIFLAFCLSGIFASSFELFNSNLFTSTAVFGVGFVSLISGVAKIWSNFFN